MKKFLLLNLLLMFFIASSLNAQNVAVGTKMWYVNWDPFFKDLLTDKLNPSTYYTFFEIDPAIMSGPTFSILYMDFGLSAALFYGHFKAEGNNWETRNPANDENAYKSETINIDRYDIDISLSYRLVSQLKIFVGYKSQLANIETRQFTVVTRTNMIYNIEEAESTEMPADVRGPGFGAGYSFNTGIFTFGANISYVILSGTYGPMKRTDYEEQKPMFYQAGDQGKLELNQNGYTIEPFVGIIAGNNAILLLGFRYQYLDSTMRFSDEGGDFGQDAQGNKIREKDFVDIFTGLSFSMSIVF
ncbi:MAG: hypothetical protein JW827_03720 [Spirochaetes bacterium]|nr:hypothetical protein [Spirochaetota bacterium]